HNILTESYQNMIVASYTARPDDINTFNEQGRLLLKMYNARALCENDELSFINYMINKGEAPLYLEPQPIWLKDIVPNTEVKRDYGIHRSSERIRNWLRTQLKGYLEEEVYTERDEEGNIITQVLGVNRIQDEMLLEELINFNEEDNFDREIAFSLEVAMAYALDSSLGTVDSLGG